LIISLRGWLLNRKYKSITRSATTKTLGISIFYSLLRYLVFAHQLYFLLIFFGGELPYVTFLSGIGAIYLLSALLPIFGLADFIVKGSVGILIFTQLGISPETVLAASLVMWLANFIAPAIVGLIMILRLNNHQISLLKNKT
jgi:uncharacterized protein (TIRG00374 family)